METDIIYNEDCLEGLSKIPDKSIDLIVIDPPYNIEIDKWDKIPNYLEFMEKVIIELKRVIKNNGSFYIWNSAKYVAEIKVLCSKHDFILNSWIIWNKKSKQQNSTRSYADITEHCLFFTLIDSTGLTKIFGNDNCFNSIRNYLKEEKKKANLKTCKQINQLLEVDDNGGGMASHYFSDKTNFKQWALPTKEMYEKLQKTGFFQKTYEDLRKEYEDLRKEYKDLIYTFNHIEIGEKRNPNDKRSFTKDVTNPTNIWEHQNTHELNKIGHTTPKPLSLIKKIIRASSKEGQIVLDCFMGSGTTALACKELNRRYIGFEINPQYIDICNKRLSQNNLSNFWSNDTHNKDLTDFQKENPKYPSDTSLNPDINRSNNRCLTR
jgi:DNA modification methylase